MRSPHPLPLLPLLLLLLLLFLLNSSVSAKCSLQLPVAPSSQTTPALSRIVNGIFAGEAELENIVSILHTPNGFPDSLCVGSLIAPSWVLTASQCSVRPFESTVRVGGATSTRGGTEYQIRASFIPDSVATGMLSDDIQLIQLQDPVSAASRRIIPVRQQLSYATRRSNSFNFMLLNNNSDFIHNGNHRYLRLKGYGLTEQPQNNDEPLQGRNARLQMADLKTADCDQPNTDDNRYICTATRSDCGPCFGDTGAPLYDVDSSGKASVQVGIVSFGDAASTSVQSPACTGGKPVLFTAVAAYVDWINDTIARNADGEEGEYPEFFFLNDDGIADVDLAREKGSLATFARTSIIVVASLVLIGIIAFCVFSRTIKSVRHRRKRRKDGLAAEESFVKGANNSQLVLDPFDGIQEQPPRFSISAMSRAAVKGATDFSSRSIAAVWAKLASQPPDEKYVPRDPIDGAPEWLSCAWENLFLPPSKAKLDKIHTVPTQRVVDDVLEGADKSVEPSLKEIEFKAARDEANLEAAWAKLEVKTSLRNLADAAKYHGQSPPYSPLAIPSQGSPRSMHSPPLSPVRFSPRTSVKMKGNGNGNGNENGDFQKSDTLLAAFAYIDAESEQVAEETMIDTDALREFVEVKRPNLLSVLRKKFSNPSSFKAIHEDREIDGEVLQHGSITSKRPDLPDTFSGGKRGVMMHSPIGGLSPGQMSPHSPGRSSPFQSLSGILSRQHTNLSSLSGLVAKGSSLGSRHSSLVMDYFSEDYGMSDSSSGDEESPNKVEDNFLNVRSRRFTGDRPTDVDVNDAPLQKLPSARTGQIRAFESFEELKSSKSERKNNGAAEIEEEVMELELPHVSFNSVQSDDAFFANMDPTQLLSNSGKSLNSSTSEDTVNTAPSATFNWDGNSFSGDDSLEGHTGQEAVPDPPALDSCSVHMENSFVVAPSSGSPKNNSPENAQQRRARTPVSRKPSRVVGNTTRGTAASESISIEMEEGALHTGHERQLSAAMERTRAPKSRAIPPSDVQVQMEDEGSSFLSRSKPSLQLLSRRRVDPLPFTGKPRSSSLGHEQRPRSSPQRTTPTKMSASLNLQAYAYDDIEAQLGESVRGEGLGESATDQVSVQKLKRMWSRMAGHD